MPNPIDVLSARPTMRSQRFDDTVALPIDTPRRLDDIIRAIGHQLRDLPQAQHQERRSSLSRVQLQRTMRHAAQARARLAQGTYGTCTDCHDSISLAWLNKKPWTPVCVYCALDI